MQVFSATITRTVTRRIELPATDKAGAGRALRPFLRPDERITRIEPADTADARDSDGHAALVWLLNLTYLPIGTKAQATLGHWLAMEMNGWHSTLPITPDRALSLAGLRVTAEDGIFIASANSVPALWNWCSGTAYEGSGLTEALITLPGATRCAGLTLAGIRARGVLLPHALVLETMERMGAAA